MPQGNCHRVAYWVFGGVVVEPDALPDDVPELDWSVVDPLVAPDEGLVLELEPAEDLSLSLSLSVSMAPEPELEDDDGEVLEPLEDGVELEPADEDELGEDGVVAEPPAEELPGVAERLDEEAPVALSPPPPLSQP